MEFLTRQLRENEGQVPAENRKSAMVQKVSGNRYAHQRSQLCEETAKYKK
jgi:hypothetical protein